MKYTSLGLTACLLLAMQTTALAADAVWKSPSFNFASVRYVQFRDITMPESMADRPLVQKTIQYAMENAAGSLKNVRVYRADAPAALIDVYVDGEVESYGETRYLVPASASTSLKSSSQTVLRYDPPTRTYYDEKITRYWTEISDHNAYYDYRSNVGIRFKLIDAKTGEVVYTYYKQPSNDKKSDAVQDISKSLGKELKKLFDK